jgi:hypothetical protein
MDTSPYSEAERLRQEAERLRQEAERLRQEGERLRQELSDSEDAEFVKKLRIAKFAQSVLSQEAWFHTANKLIAAMKLLEPYIESYWKAFNAQFLGQDSEPEPAHSLTDVYMMLAGFAIENLCKGYLVDRLSPDDRNAIKGGGSFPQSLKNHNTLELIESTEMTLSETEKFVIDQINQAIWRGRYPSSISHEDIRPFVQGGSVFRRITLLLGRLHAHVGANESCKAP